MSADYDRQALERGIFEGREASQLDCARPTLRWYSVREAGEEVARVRAFSAEAASYCVTLSRRREGLATSDVTAHETSANAPLKKS